MTAQWAGGTEVGTHGGGGTVMIVAAGGAQGEGGAVGGGAGEGGAQGAAAPARRGNQRRAARDTEHARFVTQNKSDCTCAYRAVYLLF